MKISVVGLGKLGAPLLGVLAFGGHTVVGIDNDSEKVAKISNGVAPVRETDLQKYLTDNRDRISATLSWNVAIGDTDATFVIVPTPSGADGAFSNQYILDAIEQIGAVLKNKPGYHLVVINSTTMPGSVNGDIRKALEHFSGKLIGPELGLCYNPEFIALGEVIKGLLYPDLVLIGESDPKAGDALQEIYGSLHGNTEAVVRMNIISAEITKIALNTYITTKISFANMLSEMCENLPEANADAVTQALGRDTRIGGKYLKGAVGYGGPCFPRDTKAFSVAAERAGVVASIASAAEQINGRQVQRIVNLITTLAPDAKSVAILGMSYKPGTSVVEQSQSIMLAAILSDMKFDVTCHDPEALELCHEKIGNAARYATSFEDASRNADVVVVMVPWPDYKKSSREWIASVQHRAIVIDCWGVVPDSEDLSVVRLGRSPSRVSEVVTRKL